MAGAVLVTGGSRRIGRAISLSLASSGFDIVIHTRSNDERVLQTSDEIKALGSNCFIVEGDLNTPNSVERIFNDTIELLPSSKSLVGLVNSASMFEWDDPSNANVESLISHYQVNTLAPILLSQLFFDYCKSIRTISDKSPHNSCIVNILDQKLVAPHPDHFSYTVSKHALLGAAVMMAKAFAPFCRVNCVSPGHVLASTEQSPSGFEKAQSQSPLGFGPSPTDVADAVCFFFHSKSITAQNLIVDAGEHLLQRNRDVVFETE